MSYIIVGVVAWLVVISLAMLLRRDPGEIGDLPDGVKARVGRAELTERENNSSLTGLSLTQALRTRNFWLLASVFLLWAFCLGLVMTHIIPYATDLGISTIEASTVLSLIGGLQIVARLLVGRVSDIVGRKLPGFICALLGTGALIWLIWSHNLWMFYLFAIIFGLSYGGLGVVNLTLVSDSFYGRNLGVIMGAMNVGYSVGLAIGAALGGFIFDVNGSYVVAFEIGAAAMLITGLCVVFVGREMGPEIG
jgi:MFS family permease